jgi:hypothetical protein
MSVRDRAKGIPMSTGQEIRSAPVVGKTPVSAELRETILERAVAERAAEGWALETKPDIERVLVGHNTFRRVLVRRQWGRHVHELVEVDKEGSVSTRQM